MLHNRVLYQKTSNQVNLVLDHVQDMLSVLVHSRDVAFSTVLMDSWYATKSIMLYIQYLRQKIVE